MDAAHGARRELEKKMQKFIIMGAGTFFATNMATILSGVKSSYGSQQEAEIAAARIQGFSTRIVRAA